MKGKSGLQKMSMIKRSEMSFEDLQREYIKKCQDIFASLAEFERDMISERTRAGLESARARGRKGGRPKRENENVKLALKMYDSKEYSVTEIEKATGISKATLYRRINDRENN